MSIDNKAEIINIIKKEVLWILVTVLFVVVAGWLIWGSKSRNGVVKKVIGSQCIKAGCSGQMCVGEGEEVVATTCEWKDVYGCYKLAKCELQDSGLCGFTANQDFNACLVENGFPGMDVKKGN